MICICDSEVCNLAKGTNTCEYDKYHLKQKYVGAPVEPSPALGWLLGGGEHTGCVEACRAKWGLIANATYSRSVWMEKS